MGGLAGIYFVVIVGLFIIAAFLYEYFTTNETPQPGSLPQFARVFIRLSTFFIPPVKALIHSAGFHAKTRWGDYIRE